jgi:hypothetical protein
VRAGHILDAAQESNQRPLGSPWPGPTAHRLPIVPQISIARAPDNTISVTANKATSSMIRTWEVSPIHVELSYISIGFDHFTACFTAVEVPFR